MADDSIVLSIEAGIARITLNRPNKLNSFNAAMHEALAEALDTVEADESVRVLLLTGAGKGFCAGQDLGEAGVAPGGDTPPDLGGAVERYYAPLVRRLRALAMPVVCAVNGTAAGAGANLALACDLVLAKRSAKFIEAFSKIGLIPDTGGTYFLARRVGMARAMGMAMLAEPVDAETAERWGLIWRCVDDDAFEAEVDTLVTQLAAAPTLGLARTKQLLYAGANSSLDDALDAERDAMTELGQSQDYDEGVTAFSEKRAPRFIGR
ncbi:2-(1,2-epoxy-1,2-dihydrophenyl)acetyl-CoA isomerase PaaG [Salinisphaera aquimarina]|uniref:2-(1,2-epoxy-1,2-dihydrophenyl)acetyl-CoA isomerase PaaG n=1 Tax=Salinisphaera aquimarina TaxID=2094031 RepID=A0ABV7EPL8_9GAMM